MKFLKVLLFLGVMNMQAALKVGDKAPNFRLADENGVMRSLPTDQKVVLFFYPKDGSPNCTKEVCNLRDAHAQYEKHKIAVFGISYDTPESHKEFKHKYVLPFPLLSDTQKEVTKMYGLRSGFWGMTVGYVLPRRITFLIDKGIIVAVLKNINVSEHAQEILKAFGISDQN